MKNLFIHEHVALSKCLTFFNKHTVYEKPREDLQVYVE